MQEKQITKVYGGNMRCFHKSCVCLIVCAVVIDNRERILRYIVVNATMGDAIQRDVLGGTLTNEQIKFNLNVE